MASSAVAIEIASPTESSHENIPSPSDDDDDHQQELVPRFFNQTTANLFKLGFVSVPEFNLKPFHQEEEEEEIDTPFQLNKRLNSLRQKGEIDAALELFRRIKDSKCPPNVLCYNTVIDGLVMANRPKEAKDLFDEMVLSEVVPNVSSFNILVKLYSCCLKQFDTAYEVIVEMMKCGCRPDSTTFSTLITGLCWKGRIEEAWGVLDWMLEDKCLPTVYTYTPIVQGYCFEEKIEEARKLMNTMESVSCPANSVAYNILIDALCKSGRFEEVKWVLRESESKGWKPNEITYNTIMNGLCKWGKLNETFETLGVMVKRGLCLTAVTLNILLDCLCYRLKFREARCLLEWSAGLELYDGVIGYNTLMSRLSEAGRWLDVLKLLTCMFRKGICPNTRTFNIVINSLCKHGKLDKAMCILDSRGFVANVATYNTLIHCLYLKNKNKGAKRLYRRMTKGNIAPDMITSTMMISIYCQEKDFFMATRCFLTSLKDGLDIDSFVVLIKKLAMGKKFHEVLYLFKEMRGQGYALDAFIIDTSIRAFCRAGLCHKDKIYTVFVVLDQMLIR